LGIKRSKRGFEEVSRLAYRWRPICNYIYLIVMPAFVIGTCARNRDKLLDFNMALLLADRITHKLT